MVRARGRDRNAHGAWKWKLRTSLLLAVAVGSTLAFGQPAMAAQRSPEPLSMQTGNPPREPNGGFVTGGGWITSPAGAYANDPSLTGRANFGFVSKYQKGTMIPSGETEFEFKVGSLNFRSDSYEWLVVGGTKGQYKGTGTINDAGSYRFILTAIDGQISGGGIDKFRIKITDKASGAVVYDNQMGATDDASPTTILGGGSIVIHSR